MKKKTSKSKSKNDGKGKRRAKSDGNGKRNRAAAVPLLIDFFKTSFLPSRPSLRSANSIEQYQVTISRFGDFLNHAATVADLTPANVQAFIRAILADGASNFTATNKLQHLKTLAGVAKVAGLLGADLADIDTPRPADYVMPTPQYKKRPKPPAKVGEPPPAAANNNEQDAAYLRQYLRDYFAVREVSAAYKQGMVIALGHFERFLARGATLDDLTAPVLNNFITWLFDKGLSRCAVHNYKQSIKRLWIDAYENHIIDRPVARVRKITGRREPTRAWTPDDVRRLLDVIDKLQERSQRTRILWRDLWRAFVLVAWDSGLRLGDLFSLKTEFVRGFDRFQITQQKTGKPLLVRLRPETVVAVEAIYPPMREYVFRHVLGRTKVYPWFRELCQQAGLFTEGPGLGLTRMLRRSAATAVERQYPGSAMRFLGHTSPDVTYTHYVDFSQLDTARPLVPSLLGAEQAAAFMQRPADLLATSEVLAAFPSPIASASTAGEANGPAIMLRVRDFLSSPDIVDTSVRYRQDMLSALRSGAEDCQFQAVADLSGVRLVAWIRHRRKQGLGDHRVAFLRDAWIRFVKWLMEREGVGANVPECLGHLFAADDLRRQTTTERKDGAA